MEHIDCVYYINLEHRKDRRKQIEEELDRVGVPREKRICVSGVPKPGFGILGCGLAHKKVMELFLQSPHRNCLVVEDDFQFRLDEEYIHFLLDAVFQEKVQFDCIMLAGCVLKSESSPYPFLHKVLDAHTTSGYLLTKDFAPILYRSFSESTKLLEDTFLETGMKDISYHLDIYWKHYQPISNWFIFNPKLGEQRESYSDVLERDLKYGF